MSLTFITGVKFYKGILEQLNHVTYIYDPEWNPNNSTKATFPVCFFHVKNMHEVMTAEVSQKTMLFYNSNSSPSNATSDVGILNVVADNVVTKPKSYKLDIVVPYQDLSLLNQSFIYNTQTMQAITTALLKTSGKTSAVASWSTLSQPMVKFYKDFLKTLLTQRKDGGVDDFINNVMNQPDYNKNSLECMWQLRRVLKMKVWNSWEYKYVTITDLDITKEGTEDGVYEATLTVQEMPVIYALRKKDISGFKYKNNALYAKGKAEIALLDSAEVGADKSKGIVKNYFTNLKNGEV